MKLQGSQQKQLEEALLDAFPRWQDLARMVRYGLDIDLEQIAGGLTTPRVDVVSNLVVWAQSRGKLAQLIQSAREDNSGNPELAAFVLSVGLENKVALPDERVATSLPEAEALPTELDNDQVVLRLLGERVRAANREFELRISVSAIIEDALRTGLPAEDILAAVESLVERGYVTAIRFLGPATNTLLQFTALGFDVFIRCVMPSYNDLVNKVARRIVGTPGEDSYELATALGESHMLVKHSLRVLEKTNRIETFQAFGLGPEIGLIVKVTSVSARLRRELRIQDDTQPGSETGG